MRMMETLKNAYTLKQREALHVAFDGDFRMLILHGAVRTGKTVVNNDAFVADVLRISRLPQKERGRRPQYILAGYSSSTLQNNVLNELTNKYGWEAKFDRHGNFMLFGVQIVVTYTNSERGVGSIRGMTAYGAYINEASLANRAVFDEILSRVSKPNAHIFVDTNPDTPTHWLKTDYIDNKDPDARIKSIQFVLDDNTFLSDDYVKSLKAETPSGMFYDRKILGRWVNSEGAVYRDFDESKNFVQTDDVPSIVNYFAGVDWGYEHKGVIQIWGEDSNGAVYLLDETAKQHREIDYWVDIAKGYESKYGKLVFWSDSARPEHVDRFIEEGLDARNADKRILKGIEDVAQRIKLDKLFVVKDNAQEFAKEVFEYVWDERSGKPIKENDHSMDAARYAIHNQFAENNKVQILEGIF